MMEWIPFHEGDTLGGTGFENGTILADEEFDNRCRITLEQTAGPHTITCDVYGEMFHTVFGHEDQARKIYEAMKEKLTVYLASPTTEEQKRKFYSDFFSQF